MRAFFAMVAMVPAVALAGWTNGPVVPGTTPVDVQAYDGGLFTVTIGGVTGNAFAFQWNGASATFVDGVDGGDYVGTALSSPTCAIALQAASASFTALKAVGGPGCDGGVSTMSKSGAASYLGYRLRAARVGVAGAAYTDTSNFNLDTEIGGGPWQTKTPTAVNPLKTTLSALAWNGADWFITNTTTVTVLNRADAGVSSYYSVPLAGAAPSEIALFDNGPTLGAFAISSAGDQLWRATDVGGAGFSVLSTGTGFTAVDYSQANGSANGLGFGLLAEAATILGPVPNPAAPGTQWVPRSAPAGLVAPVVRVSCADPSFCVLLDSAKNVFIYTNANKPTFSSAATVGIPSGGGPQQVLVNVADLDGDPMWITADGGALANFSLLFDGGTAANVAFDSSNCANPGTAITLTAADGWKPNDNTFTFNVAWEQIAPNTPPPLYLRAGGLPEDAGITPVCGESYAFISGDGGVNVTPMGQVTPPLNVCSEQQMTISAATLAIDGGQLIYPVPVYIEPYGSPLDPVFASNMVIQPAGSSATYQAGPDHVCGTTAGTVGTVISVNNPFIGTVTVDAGPLDVTVTSTDSCTDSADGGALIVHYQRSVTNAAVGTLPQDTQYSDAGTLTVTFIADAGPLPSTVTYNFTVTSAMNGLVQGDCGSVSSVACSAQRDYRNDVTLTQGANTIADGGFPLGNWSLVVPGSCSGNYLVNSTLTDLRFGGSVSAAPVPVTLTATQKASVDGIDGTVTLSCNGGRGDVTARIDGGCAQALSWQALGSFSVDAGTGNTAELTFQANQLDALAGTVANVEIVISDGTSNPASGQAPVLITPDRFITVERSPNPVIPSEEEPVGIELLLHNTTLCAVSGVGIREQLNGLTLVAGSVRVNGRKTDARVQGGLLSVDGLALAADATAHVTYLARVPLLSHAHPAGTVVMVRPQPDSRVSCNLTSGGQCQYDVTAPLGGSATPRQCGCGAFPDASVLLLTLVGFLFRRRSR